MPPTPADFTTKQDKEDVNTKWHLNMPDKDFREPLPPMDPEEKRDKRERLFEKFKSTTITVTSPKTNKTVQVDVLVPIHVLEGKLQEGRTVPKMHVRFHGGGFCTGAPLFKPWFPFYIRDLCLEHDAITLLPRYRLMPEVHGKEIIEDTDTFWEWYRGEETMVERWKTLVKGWKGEEFEKSMMGALKALNPSFDLEVKNGNALMVSGESAGGFLAAYSMFRHEGPHISCSLLQYPMLKAYTRDAGSPYRDKSISMEQVQSFAEERMKEIEDLEKEGTLKNLERDASNPPEGMDMAYAMSSAKRDDGSSYWRYWFDHEDIMDTLDKGPVWRGHSPFIFLLHGGKDTNCHSSQTRHLVRFVNFRQFANAVLIERTTEAHGFDYSFEASDAAQANWLPTLISMVKVTWVLDPSPAELAMVAGKLENDETQTIYSKYHEDNEATISTSAMANRSLPERKSRFDDDNYVYKPLGPPPEDAQRLMVHESRNRARSK